MQNDKNEIQKQIDLIEYEMNSPDFWDNKNLAQFKIKELNDLKDKLLGFGKYDKGGAVLSILSGAGGDDAEDFSAILLKMYIKYIESKNWNYILLHENKNDHGGYRNISIEISGKNVYGTLKNESGVHRLVRISPFNAKKLRHTSFSLVEILPILEKNDQNFKIKEDDLRIEFSKAGGPGGQNVNKRETAVRVIHIPTNISVHVATERSQEQNREKAIELLSAKLWKKLEDDKAKEKAGLSISKTADIEWGSQIRSYVFHPYKMVKDHRTGVEVNNIDKIIEDGEIDEFLDAEKDL